MEDTTSVIIKPIFINTARTNLMLLAFAQAAIVGMFLLNFLNFISNKSDVRDELYFIVYSYDLIYVCVCIKRPHKSYARASIY